MPILASLLAGFPSTPERKNTASTLYLLWRKKRLLLLSLQALPNFDAAFYLISARRCRLTARESFVCHNSLLGQSLLRSTEVCRVAP